MGNQNIESNKIWRRSKFGGDQNLGWSKSKEGSNFKKVKFLWSSNFMEVEVLGSLKFREDKNLERSTFWGCQIFRRSEFLGN